MFLKVTGENIRYATFQTYHGGVPDRARGMARVSCFEHGCAAETQDSGLFLLPASQLPGEVIQYLRSEFTTRHIPLPQGGIGITTKG
jgi:hypothetical protein